MESSSEMSTLTQRQPLCDSTYFCFHDFVSLGLRFSNWAQLFYSLLILEAPLESLDFLYSNSSTPSLSFMYVYSMCISSNTFDYSLLFLTVLLSALIGISYFHHVCWRGLLLFSVSNCSDPIRQS